MNKQIIIWCFVFLSFIFKGQINLVQNPSFESYTTCPSTQAQIQLAIGWDTLRAGGGASPDYFNKCDITTVVGVPYNPLSFQYAKSGNAYAYVATYYTLHQNYREYMQNKLSKKLQNNKTYCVTAYANLHNYSNCAIDQLGIYLDDGNISSPVNGTANNITSYIANLSGNYITDTLNWAKIQGSYTANGTEQYLTIGNFLNDSQTNFSIISNANVYTAAYYIDDVSVIESNTKAYAGQDAIICAGDSAFIGRQPEIGLECQWFNNSTQIADGAGIWVKPNATQQYIIKQDVCGTISYDTVQVILKDDNICNPTLITPTEIPNTFTPNGDGINDVWQFSLGSDVTLSPSSPLRINSVEVYNRWGNLIKHLEINSSNYILWDGRTTSGEPCTDGVYFYVLKYADAKGEVQNKKGYISLFR